MYKSAKSGGKMTGVMQFPSACGGVIDKSTRNIDTPPPTHTHLSEAITDKHKKASRIHYILTFMECIKVVPVSLAFIIVFKLIDTFSFSNLHV